jgi:hypothetical protein
MIVHVQVNAAAGPLAGALVRLKTALPDTWVQAVTPDSGHVLLNVPASLTDSQLQVTADGWIGVDRHEVVSRDVTLTVQLLARPPPFTPLPRLVPRGQFFALETGERFTAIEASDFNLLARWQHGEDIEPILQQRQDLGFNMLRVWTLYDLASASIGTFLDIDYTRIPAFLDSTARHGLYVEFTAYTSTERVDHWDRLVAAVRGKTNCLVELVNELDQPANALAHLAEYARPVGVLASHGSNGSQTWPVMEPWDYETFHLNDAPEWWRKPHNGMEIADDPAHRKPVLINESTRFCDRDSSLAHAYDSAASGALLPAGLAFHSVSGKSSVLWTGCELEAAKAHVAGAKSVDLECQPGPYTHRIDLEGSNDLRVYERPVAGHNCVVEIRK